MPYSCSRTFTEILWSSLHARPRAPSSISNNFIRGRMFVWSDVGNVARGCSIRSFRKSFQGSSCKLRLEDGEDGERARGEVGRTSVGRSLISTCHAVVHLIIVSSNDPVHPSTMSTLRRSTLLLPLPSCHPQTTSPCASSTNDMAPSRILAAALCLLSSAAAATAPCSYVFSVCSGGGGAHGVDFRSHFSVYGAQHGIGGWVRNACDDCVYGEFAGVRRKDTVCVCVCVHPSPLRCCDDCAVWLTHLCPTPARRVLSLLLTLPRPSSRRSPETCVHHVW